MIMDENINRAKSNDRSAIDMLLEAATYIEINPKSISDGLTCNRTEEESSPDNTTIDLSSNELESSSNESELESSSNESESKSYSKGSKEIYLNDLWNRVKVRSSDRLRKRAILENISRVTCIDDMRFLHRTKLVDSYAISESNEMRKYYGYRCAILPEECNLTITEYRNESKAKNLMQAHLKEHILRIESLIKNGSWPSQSEKNEDQDTEVNSTKCPKRVRSFEVTPPDSRRAQKSGLATPTCSTDFQSFEVTTPQGSKRARKSGLATPSCSTHDLSFEVTTRSKRARKSVPARPPRSTHDLSFEVTTPQDSRRGKKQLKIEHLSGIKNPAKQRNTRMKKELPSKRDQSKSVTIGKKLRNNSSKSNVRISTSTSSKNIGSYNLPSFIRSLALMKPVAEKEVQEEIAAIECIPVAESRCKKATSKPMKIEHPVSDKPVETKKEVIGSWSIGVEHNYYAQNVERRKKFIEESEKHKTETLKQSIIQHMRYLEKVSPRNHILDNELSHREDCHLYSKCEQVCRQHIKCGSCPFPIERRFYTKAFPYVHISDWPKFSEIVEIQEECSCFSSSIIDNTKEDLTTEKRSSLTSKKSARKNHKDVLECVENRKDVNNASVRAPIPSCPHSKHTKENAGTSAEERALEILAELESKPKKNNREPAQCEICKKIYTAHASLVHHYRSHANIRPFTCNICENRFTRKHSLKYHLDVHDKISRFTCQECGKDFRHPSHYREHIRRHTGETPFECELCGQKFRTRNSYKRHLKITHKKILTQNGLEDIPEIIQSES